MRRLVLITTFALGFAVFQTKPAEAFFITGTLNLAGGVRITDTGLLDFIPPVNPSTTDCPGGSQCGIASIDKVTNTDYFSVFNGPTGYNIAELDLNAALFPAGPIGTFPELLNFETTPTSIQSSFSIPLTGVFNAAACAAAGGTVSGPNCVFQTLSPRPQLTLSLTSITPCSNGCGFGFAPQFSVDFNGTNTAVRMDVTGIVCDPGNPLAQCNNYVGIFTAQFPGQSPTQLIAELDANHYIQTSFSASKISTAPASVPEPATLLLFGTGSVLVAARARRRAKAKKNQADKI